MCSAGRRGFKTCQSRKVTSASSAEYSVALSIGTRAKPMKLRPEPATSPNAIGLWPRCFSRQHVHAVIGAGRRRAHRRAASYRRSAAPRCRAVRSTSQSILHVCAIFRTLRIRAAASDARALRRAGNWPGRRSAPPKRSPASPLRWRERDVDRRVPALTHSDMPTRSACIGSSDVVSVSTARRPASNASAI